MNWLTALENGPGLDVVVWLQAQGSPLADTLARALHLAGIDAAYVALLALLLALGRWTLDSHTIRLWLLTLFVTSILVDTLKIVVQAPRPYQVAPELVREVVIQHGFGLPSGHVAHALSMFGLLAVWSRRRWLWLPVIAYTLLMAWGRMYAGVHYPQDVIAGIIVGVVSLWLSLRFFDRFMTQWNRLPLWARAAVLALGLLAVMVTPGLRF